MYIFIVMSIIILSIINEDAGDGDDDNDEDGFRLATAKPALSITL